MEDDEPFDFSAEDRATRHHRGYLYDIVCTTRALLEKVQEEHRTMSEDKRVCRQKYMELAARLEEDVKKWQNFAATWSIPQSDSSYTRMMQHFKDLFLTLKSDCHTEYARHEGMIAMCLESARPLLHQYDSTLTLLSAEKECVPFDASVPEEYWELERLARDHMWRRPL